MCLAKCGSPDYFLILGCARVGLEKARKLPSNQISLFSLSPSVHLRFLISFGGTQWVIGVKDLLRPPPPLVRSVLSHGDIYIKGSAS